MADIKWIKITTDIFDDEKILLIESMPGADSLIVIWFKLLAFAGKANNNGVFMLSERIPYTDEMLATIFRRDLNTVRLALSTFEQFGMIEYLDGVLTIPKWEKHQNVDGMDKIREQNRLRAAKHREKQKLLGCNVTGNVTVTESNAIDKDKDKDKEKDKKKIRHKYGEYKNVLFTDEEFEKLKNEFPADWRERIERLSEYMESKGKSYKNHLATIRAWARKEEPKKQTKGFTYNDHYEEGDSL